ncbi:MAG: hypothetical protein K2M05_05090 [Paramuribaculum sp.]|nr:hypothetical protein [Paramuribaculum sp.]
MVNDKQMNAWFVSPTEFTVETKNRFREMAKLAVQEYLCEARSVPSAGTAEALAIWPEILPSKGVIQPLDAFELTD